MMATVHVPKNNHLLVRVISFLLNKLLTLVLYFCNLVSHFGLGDPIIVTVPKHEFLEIGAVWKASLLFILDGGTEEDNITVKV